MTESSGAHDSSGFDGNTILLEVEDKKYSYFSGLEISEFNINDKIVDYISLMGNNMTPYAIMIGEKYRYFILHRYKFIKNKKIEEGTLLNSTDESLDPYDYHLAKCGKEAFETIKGNRIHSYWPDMESGNI